MNCERMEKQILLEQSGEISARKRRRLLEHVRVCERCRRYRDASLRLAAAWKEAAPQGDVSEWALEQIRRAARRQVSGPPRPHAVGVPFTVLWRPALAAAAVAVVLLGTWWTLWPRLRDRGEALEPRAALQPPAAASADMAWNGEFDEEILELSAVVATVAGDLGGTYGSELENTDADSIARELLELEGAT